MVKRKRGYTLHLTKSKTKNARKYVFTDYTKKIYVIQGKETVSTIIVYL